MNSRFDNGVINCIGELHPYTRMSRESFESIVQSVVEDRLGAGGRTRSPWTRSGAFIDYPVTRPSLLVGDLMALGLAQVGINWQAAPALAEMEQRVLQWLQKLVGIPDSFEGVFQENSEVATLVAFLLAREKGTNFSQFGQGLQLGKQRFGIYCSEAANSYVTQSAALAGFGRESVRKIQLDSFQRMDVECLKDTIESDKARGIIPLMVVASFGSESQLAFDDLQTIHQVTEESSMFLHMDASYLGGCLVVPSIKEYFSKNLNLCDSIAIDFCHWLNVSYDGCTLFVKDVSSLIQALSTNPSYLQTPYDQYGARNYRDWGIPLGRPFRALKYWYCFKRLGFAQILSNACSKESLGKYFVSQVSLNPDWEVHVGPSYSHVDLALAKSGSSQEAKNELTSRVCKTLACSKHISVSTCTRKGQIFCRLVFLNPFLCEADICALVLNLAEAAGVKSMGTPPIVDTCLDSQSHLSQDLDRFSKDSLQVFDFILDFRKKVSRRKVWSSCKTGSVFALLDDCIDREPCSLDHLFAELTKIIEIGVSNWQHPRFFGYFPANSNLDGVAGEYLSLGIGYLDDCFFRSAFIEDCEARASKRLLELIGLDVNVWHGTIQDTASTVSYLAVLLAREKASRMSQDTLGLSSLTSPLTIYASEHAHSSVKKAALLAGIGHDFYRSIRTTSGDLAMDCRDLLEKILEDIQSGFIPACIIATVGTTLTTACDPILEITSISRKYGIFVHVDAAMAGSAMILPEMRKLWKGIDQIDSLVWNPHKWLGIPFDCSMMCIKDLDLMQMIFPRPSSTGASNFGLFSRKKKSRALKVLYTLDNCDIKVTQERIRSNISWARWLASQAESEPDWYVLAPVSLQTVCLRHSPESLKSSSKDLDQHTLRWVNKINNSGEAYLTPAVLDGNWMVRVSIGSQNTSFEDVEFLWHLMKNSAQESMLEIQQGFQSM